MNDYEPPSGAQEQYYSTIKLKIEIKQLYERTDGRHYVEIYPLGFEGGRTLDEIEDLEINLTDIIKQLQDYRMEQENE